MGLGARAIHTYRKPGQSSLLEPDNNLPRQQRRCARRQGYANSGRMSVADQLEQIGPLDGVASCEHENRDLQSFNLIDQVLALICAEFHWVAIRLCGGAAMHTCQIAGLRHFPDGDEWTLVKVDRIDLRVHGPIRRWYWYCAQ